MVRRKKEDFANFMGSVLQNSMLTGIPQIASAGNAPKKILRALVFLFCLIGFIYQSIIFMNMYWEYKTIIDIQVDNPKRAEIPAVTVCTNNGIMTSKLCEDPEYSDKCGPVNSFERPDFCDCMPNLCIDGVLQNYTVPWRFLTHNLSHEPYEVYQPFLMPIDRLILRCYSDFKDFADVDQDCENLRWKNIRCPKSDHKTLYACYTLHTRIENPELEEEEVSTQMTEYLVLDSVPTEYNIQIKNIEMQLSIHNSRNILNPYEYGHSLQKGHDNLFRLTRTIKHLLPPPYETNCHDYLTEWKARGGRGPTTQKECIDECQRNSSLEVLGCLIHMLRGPSNERICRSHMSNEKVLQLAHECALKNCKPACYEVLYEATKDVSNFDTLGACYDIFGEMYKSIVRVGLKLDGLQTTIYTYSPKFQNIETFSYVGGYVGMWLGISLVAVFDFLETLVLMMKYPFRQYVKHRAKRARVEHIRKLQRDV